MLIPDSEVFRDLTSGVVEGVEVADLRRFGGIRSKIDGLDGLLGLNLGHSGSSFFLLVEEQLFNSSITII